MFIRQNYRQIGLNTKWNIRTLSAQAQAQVKVEFSVKEVYFVDLEKCVKLLSKLMLFKCLVVTIFQRIWILLRRI